MDIRPLTFGVVIALSACGTSEAVGSSGSGGTVRNTAEAITVALKTTMSAVTVPTASTTLLDAINARQAATADARLLAWTIKYADEIDALWAILRNPAPTSPTADERVLYCAEQNVAITDVVFSGHALGDPDDPNEFRTMVGELLDGYKACVDGDSTAAAAHLDSARQAIADFKGLVAQVTP